MLLGQAGLRVLDGALVVVTPHVIIVGLDVGRLVLLQLHVAREGIGLCCLVVLAVLEALVHVTALAVLAAVEAN